MATTTVRTACKDAYCDKAAKARGLCGKHYRKDVFESGDYEHGYIGYGYGCRCDICRAGKAARNAAEKARYRSGGRTDFVHGTLDGAFTYLCNCDTCQAVRKAYMAATLANRRANEFGTDGTLNWRDVLGLFADQRECLVPDCNTGDYLSIDHVVPMSKGGVNKMGNLQVLCRAHNASKGQATTDYRRRAGEEAA